MLGNDDINPPDDEMLKRASELVDYAEQNGEYLLDLVFGYYLFASEQPDWLEMFDVPRGLSRNRISEFVRDDRSLVVSRHLTWDEPYSSSVHIVPLWDEEHAMTLDFRDGKIISMNESPFKLEAGVLRCY